MKSIRSRRESLQATPSTESVNDAFANPITGQQLEHVLHMFSRALDTDIGPKESLQKREMIRKAKEFLCLGINNVTRTLERMPTVEREDRGKTIENRKDFTSPGKTSTHLLAILVACDTHPRLLVSHLPGLAASRNVPVLAISGGNGSGSLRLGQCISMRTAIAVGVKKGTSAVNATIQSILKGDENFSC